MVGPLPGAAELGRAGDRDRPAPPGHLDRVLETARRSGGTLLVPVADAKPGQDGADSGGDLPQRAGVDLADDIPAVADWLAGVDGPLVLGNYVYADGCGQRPRGQRRRRADRAPAGRAPRRSAR